MKSKSILDRFLDGIFSTRAVCMGCGDERGCVRPYLCNMCYAMLEGEYICAQRPRLVKRGLSNVYFVYFYGRPVRGLIHQFKFQGVRTLADYFAPSMARLVKKYALKQHIDCIVPVPLHPSRQLERGYNQAEVLANALSARTGIPVRTHLLKRVRKTRQQAKLSHEKRRDNLQNAFQASSKAKGLHILLLDDVITTGETVCSCAQALKAVGAKDVDAMSIAGIRQWRHHESMKYRLLHR